MPTRSGDASHSASTAVAFAIAGLFLVPFSCSRWSRSSRERRRPGARDGSGRTAVAGRGLGGPGRGAWARRGPDPGAAFNEMATSLQYSRDELESQNAELEAQQGELERTVEELADERDRIQGFHEFVSRLPRKTRSTRLARR